MLDVACRTEFKGIFLPINTAAFPRISAHWLRINGKQASMKSFTESGSSSPCKKKNDQHQQTQNEREIAIHTHNKFDKILDEGSVLQLSVLQ